MYYKSLVPFAFTLFACSYQSNAPRYFVILHLKCMQFHCMVGRHAIFICNLDNMPYSDIFRDIGERLLVYTSVLCGNITNFLVSLKSSEVWRCLMVKR